MLVNEAGVILTPGLSCRASEPGMFRLCFAAVPEGGVEVGMKRIERALPAIRHFRAPVPPLLPTQ